MEKEPLVITVGRTMGRKDESLSVGPRNANYDILAENVELIHSYSLIQLAENGQDRNKRSQ